MLVKIKRVISTKAISRTYKNYTGITQGRGNNEFWGRCSPECRGEMPAPDSEYNLAREEQVFSSAWSHGLYSDLQKWEAGFCFTYDPPQQSGSGVANGLYFMLGHEYLYKEYNSSTWGDRDSSAMLTNFDIFLHEKVSKMFQNLHFNLFYPIFLRDNSG